jgi:peroxiredoxin
MLIAQKAPKVKAGLHPKTPVTLKTNATTNAGGFVINGEIKGYPDGTPVALLNGQSGTAEIESTIKANKFTFKGKVESAEFKIILVNNQQPYITLFLDNSNVKIVGTKENIDKSKITGSKAHADFEVFNDLLSPYAQVFTDNAFDDTAKINKAMDLAEEFATTHPTSAITPLSIIRYNQIADDMDKTYKLYEAMAPEVKAMPMGRYLAQMILDDKKNTGMILADFSQPDTAGNMIKLSSFRGKYVLLDFWASWCGPCRAENPNVVKAFNKYKDKNFTILAVSLDKAKPAWLDAIKMDNLTWTHVSDLQGWANTVALQYQIFSIPQNYLLDPEGKVIGKNLRGNSLEKRLARVFR